MKKGPIIFDLFGLGRHIYTFKNFCQEDKNLSLGDDTTKVFLNATGTMDDVKGDLKAFLEYIAGEVPDNDFVQALDSAVDKAKKMRNGICHQFWQKIDDLLAHQRNTFGGVNI